MKLHNLDSDAKHEPPDAPRSGFEELLTLEQAAARLGLLADRTPAHAVGAVRWLIRTRKLPAIRLHYRCWRIRPSDLESYIARQRSR